MKRQVKGFFHEQFDSAVKDILVRNPLLLFDYSVKDFKVEKRARVSLIIFRGRSYVIKHYNVKSVFFWVRRAFFSSLAAKVQRQVELLQQNNLSTPLLFAAVDNGRGFGYKGTTCVYEYVQPDKEKKQLQQEFSNSEGRAVIQSAVVSFLARIHNVGIYHGDAKISNFLWLERSSGIDINIIDLDNCRIQAKLSRSQRIADLSTLIFSLAWWDNDPSLVSECLSIYMQADLFWCHDQDAVLVDLRKRVAQKLDHRRKRQKNIPVVSIQK